MKTALILDFIGNHNDRQTKTERFFEMLVTCDSEGVSRWQIVGRLKTTSPGYYRQRARDIGVTLTRGREYKPISLLDFIKCLQHLDQLRAQRFACPLPIEVKQKLILDYVNSYQD
ncbi:hypothetical protein [Ferrimonas sp. YFM]|uniref:hypothetical protein n=1 Tax=Ferrimonas sp. YFM TaxID=3028878 RepID=UPI00257259B0|nr:hypothetical protein [Ferrimonas sp. YFM]BDY03813.1 hypothetical protein F0521_08540 [Ferrimonas sp. YFM]